MIATILIVGIALAWLGYETNWLTIQLECRESIREYDKRIFREMTEQSRQEEVAYQKWLADRYEPTYTTKPMPSQLEPYQKIGHIEEGLAKRRAGEMLYQRGNKHVRI